MTTIESTLYLGEVVYLGHRGPMSVASIRPLLSANEDGTWSTEFTENDRYYEFPNAGRVSWLNPHADATLGTLWEFRIEEQPTFVSTDMKRDRYMVAPHGIRQVFEVVSLAALDTSQKSPREILLEDGLELGASAVQRCWLQMEPSLWMLTDLEPVPDRDGYLRVKLESSGITRWHRWELAAQLAVLNGEKRRYVLPPQVTPSGHPQQRDWADDLTVLRRVLQQARTHDREFMESLGLTKKAIEHLSKVLGESAPVNDPELHEARIDRALKYLDRLQREADRTYAVAAILADSPLAEDIELNKQTILKEERIKARQQAESEQNNVKADTDRLRTELHEIEKEIAQKRREQESLVSELDATIAEKARNAMDSPVSLLSTSALVRAVSDPRTHMGGEAKGLISASLASPYAERQTSHKDTLAAVECNMLLMDVPPTAGRAIYISHMGGALPVLIGDRALDALLAYSSAVTGGQLLTLSVSSLWVDPSDYLSSTSIASNNNEVRNFLESARVDTRMHLLVFEGIERSCPESYLIPLLKRIAAQASLHTDAAAAVGFSWPENVLIAATASTSSVTTALCPELCEFCTFLFLDLLATEAGQMALANQHPEKRRQSLAKLTPKFVEAEYWQEWQRQGQEADLRPCASEWARLTDGMAIGRAKRDVALRLFSTGITVADEASVLSLLKAIAVLPNLIHNERRLKSLLDEVVPIYPEKEQALRLWTDR